jgi:hypothetical protein
VKKNIMEAINITDTGTQNILTPRPKRKIGGSKAAGTLKIDF